MPRSKSRKTNRRSATAAKTASSRARPDGQQAVRADPQIAAAISRADGEPGAAGQAPAKTGPAKTGPAKPGPAKPGPADRATASQAPAKASPAKPGRARAAAAGQAPAGPAAVSGAHPGLTPARKLPPGLAPGPQRAKAAAAKTAPAKAEATASGETPEELPAWVAKATEKVLTVTYWLDPGEQGDSFSATIYFSGRRAGVTGKPRPGDTFSQEETVDPIVPGSGPVAITAEVRGVNPGEWTVTARPVARPGGSPVRPYPPPGANASGARRVLWPRRVVVPAGPIATVRTAMLPFTKVPGIVRFAYASLISLGVLTALGLEALLLIAHHYSAFGPVGFSVAAVAAGAVGAKAWYIAVHRGRKFDGWCIQGLVAGVAAVIVAAALAGTGVPARSYLSAAGPALLIGMGIGRLGCFWAGCCTGRPTASRWGIWSSDRRVGCRREPAQLLEALTALVAGLVVLAVVLVAGPQRSAPAAAAGLAAYTLGRQFIIGLRAEPRQWRYGRRVAAAVAAVVLIASVALLARG